MGRCVSDKTGVLSCHALSPWVFDSTKSFSSPHSCIRCDTTRGVPCVRAAGERLAGERHVCATACGDRWRWGRLQSRHGGRCEHEGGAGAGRWVRAGAVGLARVAGVRGAGRTSQEGRRQATSTGSEERDKVRLLCSQTVLFLVEMVSPLCVRPRGRGVLGLYLRGVPVLLMTRAAPSVLLLVVLGAVQQEAGGHAARGDPSFTLGRPARGEQEAEMGGGGGARTVSRGGVGGKSVIVVDEIWDWLHTSTTMPDMRA